MPSTLALAARGGRAITMSVPQYRYARMAARYGPTAARAAGKIARFAFKKWRARRRGGYRSAKRARFSRSNIGERIGTSNAKTAIQTRLQAANGRNTRTLYSRNLTSLTFGGNINQRERNVVNCRGFKICMQIRNDNSEPMYVNVAVVSPKNSGSVAPANFFRSHGPERASDFDNQKTGMEMNCLGLNTDKFDILRRKRYRLRGNGVAGDFVQDSGSNYIDIDWYIKLKRQLRFDRNEAESPTDGVVYLIYWMDKYFASQGQVPSLNALTVQERYWMFYRETKN